MMMKQRNKPAGKFKDAVCRADYFPIEPLDFFVSLVVAVALRLN